MFPSANTSITFNPERIIIHPKLRSLRHWLEFTGKGQDVEHIHLVYLNETIQDLCRIYANQIIALCFKFGNSGLDVRL